MSGKCRSDVRVVVVTEVLLPDIISSLNSSIAGNSLPTASDNRV